MRSRATGLNATLLAGAIVALAGCSASSDEPREVPDTDLPVTEVLSRPDGFTQGFEVLSDGQWLMGTGGYGESQIQVVDADGKVVESANLPDEEFGEGTTVIGDTAYQLTWQSGVVHTWTLPDFQPGSSQSIEGEGWGLCSDEAAGGLWLSDGTPTLSLVDAESFDTISQVQVSDANQPVFNLNELECIDGAVWANVWQTNDIVVIDPSTGDVTRTYDFSDLAADQDTSEPGHVLNGIAYDDSSDSLLITGKEWDAVYRLDYAELIEQ